MIINKQRRGNISRKIQKRKTEGDTTGEGREGEPTAFPIQGVRFFFFLS